MLIWVRLKLKVDNNHSHYLDLQQVHVQNTPLQLPQIAYGAETDS